MPTLPNNVLQFIESILHLGTKAVGLFRADSGFYDAAILNLLEGKKIDYIISAKMHRARRCPCLLTTLISGLALWGNGDDADASHR